MFMQSNYACDILIISTACMIKLYSLRIKWTYRFKICGVQRKKSIYIKTLKIGIPVTKKKLVQAKHSKYTSWCNVYFKPLTTCKQTLPVRVTISTRTVGC